MILLLLVALIGSLFIPPTVLPATMRSKFCCWMSGNNKEEK